MDTAKSSPATAKMPFPKRPPAYRALIRGSPSCPSSHLWLFGMDFIGAITHIEDAGPAGLCQFLTHNDLNQQAWLKDLGLAVDGWVAWANRPTVYRSAMKILLTELMF